MKRNAWADSKPGVWRVVSDLRVAMIPDLSIVSIMLHALLGDGQAAPDPVRLRLSAVMQGSAGLQALRPVLTPVGGRR